MEISIHALAKRATFYQCFFFATARISIHALAKRATTLYSLAPSEMEISIHALAKRATVWASQDSFGKVDFNPRPREEGDR